MVCYVCSNRIENVAYFLKCPDGKKHGPLCGVCRNAAEPYLEYWENHSNELQAQITRLQEEVKYWKKEVRTKRKIVNGIEQQKQIKSITEKAEDVVNTLNMAFYYLGVTKNNPVRICVDKLAKELKKQGVNDE